MNAVRVRYFAAAKAAMGEDEEIVEGVADIGALLADAWGRVPSAAKVLGRCSFLVDGVATKDPATPLADGVLVDVLPPFAGG